MSIRVMTTVWDESEASGSKLLLLLAIADHANDDGFAFPSVPHLARKARMSERHVQRVVGELEAMGELEVHEAHGRGYKNTYTVLTGKATNTSGFSEKVTSPARKVTSSAKKGDVAVGATLYNLDQPSGEPSLGELDDNASSQQQLSGFKEKKINPAKPKPITDVFVARMKETNPDLDIDAELEKAMNHVAYTKAINKQAYFRNWIANARKFQRQGRKDAKSQRSSDDGWGDIQPDLIVGD